MKRPPVSVKQMGTGICPGAKRGWAESGHLVLALGSAGYQPEAFSLAARGGDCRWPPVGPRRSTLYTLHGGANARHAMGG